MKEKILYITEDGKEFSNKDIAIEYENLLRKNKRRREKRQPFEEKCDIIEE